MSAMMTVLMVMPIMSGNRSQGHQSYTTVRHRFALRCRGCRRKAFLTLDPSDAKGRPRNDSTSSFCCRPLEVLFYPHVYVRSEASVCPRSFGLKEAVKGCSMPVGRLLADLRT